MSAQRGKRESPGALFAGGPFEAARWGSSLPAGSFGRAWLGYFAETGSTQDEAFRAAARGAVHGSAFVADCQSAGRGRRGAAWKAPAGSSLLLSVLLRPAPPAALSGRLALAAAAAAARAVESVAPRLSVEVKWPNDLHVGGRKLGGILVESRRGAAVVGIGVNVSQRAADFAPELRERATSLAIASGAAMERRALLAAILAEFGRVFRSAEVSSAQWERLRAEAGSRLAWRGREVRVTGCAGGSFCGRLAGLAENGGLVVETGEGAARTVVSGSLEPGPEPSASGA